MIIKSFEQHSDWVKLWAGHWCILSCVDFAYQYTHTLKIRGRVFLDQSVIIIEQGRSAGYAHESNRVEWGKYLAQEISRNPKRVKAICKNLKAEVDRILSFLRDHEKGPVTGDIYEQYLKLVGSYYIPHVNVKFVVDFLEPKLLNRYLHDFEEARVYAEPVFKKTEEFIQRLCKLIGAKTKCKPELISCLTVDELRQYFNNEELPTKQALIKRNKKTALLFDKKRSILVAGKDADKVQKMVSKVSGNLLKGTSAYPGKIAGTVRIVLDPKNDKGFKVGDVLVAGSTRPEYLSLMKKAAAFVTDAGGILSHAAIVARELKKPCVIGTQTATKILKDGQKVEVDANKGTVTILQ